MTTRRAGGCPTQHLRSYGVPELLEFNYLSSSLLLANAAPYPGFFPGRTSEGPVMGSMPAYYGRLLRVDRTRAKCNTIHAKHWNQGTMTPEQSSRFVGQLCWPLSGKPQCREGAPRFSQTQPLPVRTLWRGNVRVHAKQLCAVLPNL